MSWNDYAFVTGVDGVLDHSTPADVRLIVASITEANHAVLHLHGGLVSESGAKATAEALAPVYLEKGSVHPAFIIYRTGFLEIIKGHLLEIARESFYQSVLGKVLKWARGKLSAGTGAKASGPADLPFDLDVRRELKKLERDEEPFAGATGMPEDISQAELDQFQQELELDEEFQNACEAVAKVYIHEPDRASKGVAGGSVRAAEGTLLSPVVIDELTGDESDAKGFWSTAKTVIRAGLVLKRVIGRFRAGRDHGLYTTVVEELLRAFYLANVGTAVWEAMKGETSDTFLSGEPARGGRTFVDELGIRIADGKRPDFSVVAHSLGSVFACRLIDDLAACRADSNHPLPADFRLKNLILLAPAVDYSLFDRMLNRHSELIENLRMFALTDSLEAGYWEVPGVYPRSLLYLVSGLLERDSDGDSVPDMPLVGMQRYFSNDDVYNMPEVERVRRFLAEPGQNRIVWAVCEVGPGMSSDAKKHGAFDDAPPETNTMLHVCHMLNQE